MANVVGIDGNEANVSSRVGSNVYAFEVLHALYGWLEKEQKFSVIVYTAGAPLEDLPAETSWWQYRVVPQVPLWTLWRLPWELWKKKEIDLFFSPGHYLPSFAPVPMVPTIMDIAFEFFPEQFKQKDYWQLHMLTKRSIASAAHILAISESTKNDVAEHYNRENADITVAYPGVPKNLHRPSVEIRQKTKKTFALKKPFLLYVGTLQPRKNLERLIAAFETVRASGWDGELVLAGKAGWKSEPIVRRMDTSPEKDHIHQLGFVTDEEKFALLAEAEVLVLPGLYEGFGFPPLEAICLGTVPVVSNVSSLPEVVGEDGIQVDPTSVSDIARGIQEALACTPAEKKKLLAKLQAHTEQFSWKKTGAVVGNTLWETLTNARVL